MRWLRPSDALRPINWAIDVVADWVMEQVGQLWDPDVLIDAYQDRMERASPAPEEVMLDSQDR